MQELENAGSVLASLVSLSEKMDFENEDVEKTFVPAFENISEALGSLGSLVKGELKNDKNEEISKNAQQFAFMFNKSMDLCLALFMRGAFPTKSQTSFIVFLTYLHLLYFKMIKNQEQPVDRTHFITIWSYLYYLFREF